MDSFTNSLHADIGRHGACREAIRGLFDFPQEPKVRRLRTMFLLNDFCQVRNQALWLLDILASKQSNVNRMKMLNLPKGIQVLLNETDLLAWQY